MLQVIRERAQGFFAWLIIGAIIVTVGLFGLSSYFDDTEEAFQAALVNNEKVTVYEYQIAYSNEKARMQQMFGNNFDPDIFDAQIKKSALDRVIDNALLIQTAADKDMYISDEQLANRIQNIEAFRENGVFSKSLYEQQLEQSGESTAGFEYRIRRGLIADQLVNGIINTSFATKDEIDLTYKLRQQEREVAYVTLPLSKFNDKVTIADDEIKSHFEQNQDKYQTEELVKVKYLELTIEDLMPGVEIDNNELQDFYETQKDRFTTPEERHAKHILIEFGDDEAKAKTKAQTLYEKAKSGEDFASLAKENSDDVGSKGDGGDLGFFGRGVMDENFENKTFSMNQGEISEPVKSQFGFHIIKLEEIKASAGKTFDDVKSEIETEIRRTKAEKVYIDRSEKLANLAYENPDNLEAAEAELGMKIKISPFFGNRGGSGIFSNRKLIDTAFSTEVLQDKLNSAAIELGNNKMVVIRLDEHKPSQPRALEEVREQIKNTLQRNKALDLAKVEASKLEDKLKKGESISDEVKTAEYTWQDKKWIKRENTEVAREIVQALFSMPRSADNSVQSKGLSLTNGDYSVVVFSAIKDGDSSTMPAEDKTSIADGIANATGINSFTEFLKSIKDHAKIETFPSNL